MNFPNKSKVTVAAPGRNHFDVSQQYVGTMDFGSLVPVNWRMCRNGEHYKIKPMSFLRCAPLVVPTFGRIRMIMDTFFVPYHQIFENWENFKSRQSYVNANGTAYAVTSVPTISADDLLKLFYGTDGVDAPTSNSFVTISSWINLEETPSILQFNQIARSRSWSGYASEALPAYDFVVGVHLTADSTIDQVKFGTLTQFGKMMYNIFVSLGYNLDFGFNLPFPSTTLQTKYVYADQSAKVSALNLLAFVKVFVDWYQSNQFTNDSALRKVLQKITSTNYGVDLWYNDLVSLCVNYVRCYDQDLYTASYLTPNADTNLVGMRSPSNHIEKDSYVIDSNEGVRVQGTSSGTSILNIQMAMRLQNYADRWRVGGQRDIDRDLSEFGVKSRDIDYHRSNLINSYSQDLMISDVMSNSENPSVGLQLGSYAGKGLSYGDSSFSLECDDDGVLLTIGSIVPHIGYVYGQPKELSDLKLFDFYTPEFDSVGVEAISMRQLTNFGDTDSNNISGFTLDSVFGYVPRYAHLKVGHDTLAGDFRIPSLSKESDAWHLFRKDYKEKLANNEYFRQICNFTANSPGLVNAQTDAYDRIFNVTDSAEDHFYLFCDFNIQLEANMRSISESLIPYYDGESHKEVSVDYNGKQL